MPPCFTPLDTQKDLEKVFPHLICIFWREYHTINNLAINSGTLRLINFLNSSQCSSLSKSLLASKNVTNTVVDRFLYNSMYSLRVYNNSVPCAFLNPNRFTLVHRYSLRFSKRIDSNSLEIIVANAIAR